MSEAIQRESALHGALGRFSPAANGLLRFTERGHLGYVNLRGDPTDAGFLAAARSVLGVDLPIAANTVAESGVHTVFWLGPNEWLVVTAALAERGTANVLRTALAGQFVSVTEVGGGMTCLRVEGSPARALLERECPLDLHPREFLVGRCAQSHFAKAPVILHARGGDCVDVFVRRSFSDYLWALLTDLGAEFGVVAARA